MTELARYDFETQTSGSQITVSAPWNLRQGATPEPFIASAAAAMHGALGGRIEAATGNRGLFFERAESSNPLVIDVYVKPRAVPAAAYFLSMHDDSAGGATRADVRFNTAGTVSMRNAGTAVATSVPVLDMDEWYRIAWGSLVAGTQELRCYQGEATEPVFTLSGALTSNAHTRIGTGLPVASAGFSADFDTVRVGDDWFAPINPVVPLPNLPLTLGAKTDVTVHGGSNGTQVVSWSPVDGAARYRAERNIGAGFEVVSESAGSPFTFTGLPAGTHQVRITAMAE